MGCGSSASATSAEEEQQKMKLAQRQRRKLSVKPDKVGQVDKDKKAGVEKLDVDPVASGEPSPEEIKAKGSFEHAIISQKGYIPYNKEKKNQDRPVLKYGLGKRDNVSLFGVMDGHGEFGHLISQFVMEQLPQLISDALPEGDVPTTETQYILDGTKNMCDAVHKTDINLAFSGTTCVFGVLVDKTLHVANIGDSRCVMLQESNGTVKAKDLSEDQKPENPEEKKRILEAGGRVETLPGPPDEDCGPYRVWLGDVDVPGLAMSRSIGDEVSQTVGVISVPEIRTHELCDEDRILIFASDGVWEFISSAEACELVFKFKDNVQKAAEELVKEATKRWRLEEEVIDDITVTMVQVNKYS